MTLITSYVHTQTLPIKHSPIIRAPSSIPSSLKRMAIQRPVDSESQTRRDQVTQWLRKILASVVVGREKKNYFVGMVSLLTKIMIHRRCNQSRSDLWLVPRPPWKAIFPSPSVLIVDSPEFEHRGLNLDICRNWISCGGDGSNGVAFAEQGRV